MSHLRGTLLATAFVLPLSFFLFGFQFGSVLWSLVLGFFFTCLWKHSA